MPGPGVDFFRKAGRRLTHMPFIAEDLGVITAEARETMRLFRIPGTKPLTFALDETLGESPFAPHNLERDNVVYTGTHDANPVRGWYETEASQEQKRQLSRYLGRRLTADSVAPALIRLAMMTVADTVIIPLQDVLGLVADARMNRPGTLQRNWIWRCREDQFARETAEKLAGWTEL